MCQRSNLHRNDANDAAPSESDPAAVEQAHVEPVRPPLHLCEHLAIVLGEAWWQSLAPLLEFPVRRAVESRGRDLLKVWILQRRGVLGCHVPAHWMRCAVRVRWGVITSRPKLFLTLSPRILLPIALARKEVMTAMLQLLGKEEKDCKNG